MHPGSWNPSAGPPKPRRWRTAPEPATAGRRRPAEVPSTRSLSRPRPAAGRRQNSRAGPRTTGRWPRARGAPADQTDEQPEHQAPRGLVLAFARRAGNEAAPMAQEYNARAAPGQEFMSADPPAGENKGGNGLADSSHRLSTKGRRPFAVGAGGAAIFTS